MNYPDPAKAGREYQQVVKELIKNVFVIISNLPLLINPILELVNLLLVFFIIIFSLLLIISFSILTGMISYTLIIKKMVVVKRND